MFLGTHAPRLDEKGRLILPAKYREELAGGVVITKGQERCLYVFPQEEFARITEALRTAPVTAKSVRDYSRVFFASASDELPDRQGRITVPRRPAQLRRAGAGLRGDRREHPARDLGRASLGDLPRRSRGLVRRSRRGGAPGNPVVPHAGPHPPLPAGITSPVPAGSASGWGRRGPRNPRPATADQQGGTRGQRQSTCRCWPTASPPCSRPPWPPRAPCWWTPPWAGPVTPAPCSRPVRACS